MKDLIESVMAVARLALVVMMVSVTTYAACDAMGMDVDMSWFVPAVENTPVEVTFECVTKTSYHRDGYEFDNYVMTTIYGSDDLVVGKDYRIISMDTRGVYAGEADEYDMTITSVKENKNSYKVDYVSGNYVGTVYVQKDLSNYEYEECV